VNGILQIDKNFKDFGWLSISKILSSQKSSTISDIYKVGYSNYKSK